MEDACKERHKRIDGRLDVQDRRLNNHSERLDRIELANGKLEERLNNLITQLEQLNKTMKWFMGLLLGGIVGNFDKIVSSDSIRTTAKDETCGNFPSNSDPGIRTNVILEVVDKIEKRGLCWTSYLSVIPSCLFRADCKT